MYGSFSTHPWYIDWLPNMWGHPWETIIRTLPRGRVAEVVQGHGGPPPKGLDSNENFKSEHTFFCRELRFVAIYTLFGELWAKKVPFGVKTSASCARSALLHGLYCIFYWVKFANLRLCSKTTHFLQKLYIRVWRKFSWLLLSPTKGCQVLPPWRHCNYFWVIDFCP